MQRTTQAPNQMVHTHDPKMEPQRTASLPKQQVELLTNASWFLQRQVGNAGMQSPTAVVLDAAHPELKINQPCDEYEQEAEQVAEQAMQIPETKVARLGSFLPIFDLSVQRQTAVKESKQQPNQPVYDRPIADRPNFCFIMASDVYELARWYAQTYYAQSHKIMSASSLCALLKEIQFQVTFGEKRQHSIGQVVIISHSTKEGEIFFPINDADKRSSFTPAEIGQILSKDWLSRTNVVCRTAALDVAQASDAQTHVIVKGCNLGQNRAAVDAIREMFGGQATVTAYKAQVMLETVGYGPKVRGRRTPQEVISWMARNRYLPPESEEWPEEQKEAFVLNLFPSNWQQTGISGIPMEYLTIRGQKVLPSDPSYTQYLEVSRPATGLARAVDMRGVTPNRDHISAPPIVHDVLRSPGQPLDDATRTFMEPRFGQDFSHVRVHTDAHAAESARAVNALAYTVGRDVVFGVGQYTPGTGEGWRLIAHELAHVVQQTQSNYRTLPAANDSSLEQDADIAANQVAYGDSTARVTKGSVTRIARQPKTNLITAGINYIPALYQVEETRLDNGMVKIRVWGTVGDPIDRSGLEEKYPASSKVGLDGFVRWHLAGPNAIGAEEGIVYAPENFNVSRTASIENIIRRARTAVRQTGGDVFFDFTAICKVKGTYEGVEIRVLEEVTWKAEVRLGGSDKTIPIINEPPTKPAGSTVITKPSTPSASNVSPGSAPQPAVSSPAIVAKVKTGAKVISLFGALMFTEPAEAVTSVPAPVEVAQQTTKSGATKNIRAQAEPSPIKGSYEPAYTSKPASELGVNPKPSPSIGQPAESAVKSLPQSPSSASGGAKAPPVVPASTITTYRNPIFRIEPIGGAAMWAYSNLLSIQFEKIDRAAKAELDRKKPEIEALLKRNLYVAVIVLVEEPKRKDILSSMSGFIEAKDIPVYKGLAIQTGHTEELAKNPTASIGPLPSEARPYEFSLPSNNRVISQSLYAFYRPIPQLPTLAPIKLKLVGTYENEQSPHNFEIHYRDKASINISAWDKKDGERYVVNLVRWDREQGEIDVTFFKPSTDYTIKSRFLVVNHGTLREYYSAGRLPHLTEQGDRYWLSSTASLLGFAEMRSFH